VRLRVNAKLHHQHGWDQQPLVKHREQRNLQCHFHGLPRVHPPERAHNIHSHYVWMAPELDWSGNNDARTDTIPDGVANDGIPNGVANEIPDAIADGVANDVIADAIADGADASSDVRLDGFMFRAHHAWQHELGAIQRRWDLC
jgi:hypothetical protein